MADFNEQDQKRLNEINAQLEKRTRRTKVYIDLEKEAAELLKRQVAAKKELNAEFKRGTDAQKAAAKFTKEQKQAEAALNVDLASRVTNLLKGNIAQGLSLDFSKKSKIAQSKLADEAARQSKILIENTDLNSKQKLGLLNLNRDIVDGLTEEGEEEARLKALRLGGNTEITNDAKELTELKKKQVEAEEESESKMKGYTKALGLAGAVAVVLFKVISNFAAKIDDVGKSFGFLTSKNTEFRDGLIDAGNEAIMIGKGLGDVLSVTAELSSEFGLTLAEAGDLSNKVLDTAVATGLSNDEATKLFGTFMQIGDLTAKQTERLVEGTAQLAAQRGVAPNAVLRDLAGSAEEIAKFTDASGFNIAEAAVQARLFGVSLQTTAKISEGLLDFESSINAEVEASVLIGRRLNFQKARQLALEGNLKDATKEVVNQLGSEEELNKLNVLQRQSIAKSIGVSVVELNKLVRGQDKLTLSTALTGKKFEDLVGQDSLSTLTSIINSIKAIGATLLDNFGRPLNEFIERFRKTLTGEEGLARIRQFANSFGNILLGLGNLVSFVTSPFSEGSYKRMTPEDFGFGRPTNDYRGGRGGISVMAGPAGVFRLNPMDSVIATTNPIPTNDYGPKPAGSVGGMTQKVEVTGTITGTRDSLIAVIEPALG